SEQKQRRDFPPLFFPEERMTEQLPDSYETAGLDRVRQLMQSGSFSAAVSLLVEVLERTPQHTEALFLLAACHRYLHAYPDALIVLKQLTALDENYGRAWQETGHVHLALNNTQLAIDAFKIAVAKNPALLPSWQKLSALVPQESPTHQQALRQTAYLSSLPKALLSASNMLNEGKLYRAEQICRHFLQSHPKHVEGMRMLAAIGMKYDILDDAEFLLESALTFEPDHLGARSDYIAVLQKRQKFGKAFEEATRLLSADPENPVFRTIYANQCMAVGRFREALELYEDLSAIITADPTFYLTWGHGLKTVGNTETAIRQYRKASELRKDFGDAYWSLANLKTYQFTDSEVKVMQVMAESKDISDEDRLHFCFALGKHEEDQGLFDEAFRHYETGNKLRKAQLSYQKEKMTERLQLQQQVCTADFFREREDWGCPDNAPVFITGLPRAGSTLLEQILASHSMVDGTLELHNIGALAQKLDGRLKPGEAPRYPARLTELSRQQCLDMGMQYIEETRIHRQGAPFFIDKMPNNFRHIGLIRLILPNATIIDARRHPLACCFSGFKQLFASGQEFTYGLEEIGQYYRDYVNLMEHWQRVLPGYILQVQYEAVVADLTTQVRRILDFCDLPFEEACLNFHETDRSVRTPSSEQVRQPIYQSGLAPWKPFEKHLQPLHNILGDLIPQT
ncbi:MAG: sulfotransferase, partial [Pseudomonadales bacterium]|nr:sulfotransferase [Pseudomonadales bacterium]